MDEQQRRPSKSRCTLAQSQHALLQLQCYASLREQDAAATHMNIWLMVHQAFATKSARCLDVSLCRAFWGCVAAIDLRVRHQ